MGKGTGNVFSSSNDTIKGTGQTIGDLEKSGWTNGEISDLVKQQGTSMSGPRRGLLVGKGLMTGLAAQQPVQRGAGAVISMPDQPQMPADLVQPTTDWRTMAMTNPRRNYFFGA